MTPSVRLMREEFRDVLFLHAWEHVRVSLNSCDCFQMCAVSVSSLSLVLPLSVFFISHRLLNCSGLFSSIHPLICHPLWAPTGPAWCKRSERQQPKLPLGVSPLPPVWVPRGAQQGSQGLSDAEAVGPLRYCAPPGALVSLQDLAADTHMVLITRRE